MMVCEKVLKELEHGIPENASYRYALISQSSDASSRLSPRRSTGTAAIFKERLKIAQENLDPRDIERLIDCGQIEELIIQGEKELSLIPDMRENKPWDVPPDHKINIIIRCVAFVTTRCVSLSYACAVRSPWSSRIRLALCSTSPLLHLRSELLLTV